MIVPHREAHDCYRDQKGLPIVSNGTSSPTGTIVTTVQQSWNSASLKEKLLVGSPSPFSSSRGTVVIQE
eukprot:4912830-Pyramimonas_sp.AAC.1